jgi:protease I
MPLINKSRILIMATHGFEQSELEKPLHQLKAKGAKVEVAAPEAGQIKGWQGGDWGSPVPVDLTLDDVEVGNYDALVLPGGVINPDKLRVNKKALAIIKDFLGAGKVVAAICHGPWLLVEVGAVKGT